MNINKQKITTALFSAFVLVVPVFTWAAVGIPCDGPNCTFDDVIKLANNVIHFLMVDVAVPLAAIGFMFSGAKLVLNQDKEGAWSEAKEGFGNIGKGFLLMLGAYILIKTILFAFLTQEQATLVQFMFQ